MQTHFRTCNLCEAMCGLEIKVENGTVTKIEGDKNDAFSRGHICPKAVALKDIYEDPDRLKTPIKKTANGWQSISWEEAYQEIFTKTNELRAKYGNDAIAIYQGNPTIHNLGSMLFASSFFKLFKTKNFYTATSTDQLPHHFASWLMFGHPMLLPVPDIDHTDFMLIIGGNPIASNGSMMSVPDVANRLRAIQQRQGKVVVIDPRFTETAAKADTHYFIRPSTDVFLLLAMIHVLFEDNLLKMNRLSEFSEGLAELKLISLTFSPEKVEKSTGILATDIRQLTHDFAKAKSAVCYGRVGVSTQAFGGLCQWLINCLNILTGNLDKTGGAMFTLPAIDFIGVAKPYTKYGRWHSRVRGLPEFLGELPVACLAEEILTEGEGQVRALFTSCGNPVLSTPNGKQVGKALEKLDFMVSFDIYLNETTCHADIILPPATGLEVPHYDITFHSLAVRNTSKYSPPLFDKSEGAKYDWEIFQELAHVFSQSQEPYKPQSPEKKLDLGLRYGPYQLSLEQVKQNVHGIDLGVLKSQLPERLLTENKKINLAPKLLIDDVERAKKALQNSFTSSEFNYLLIGRRHLRDNNSWMHNSERLMKGKNRCTLMIHSVDAQELNLKDKDHVRVISKVGSVQLPIQISDHQMQGVVCMPHGYGHLYSDTKQVVASRYAGVSINDLTDENLLDELTGNAAFSNVAVRIEKAM